MIFCPNCCNLLLTRQGRSSQQQFYCQACPYIFDVTETVCAC